MAKEEANPFPIGSKPRRAWFRAKRSGDPLADCLSDELIGASDAETARAHKIVELARSQSATQAPSGGKRWRPPPKKTKLVFEPGEQERLIAEALAKRAAATKTARPT